MIMRPRRGGAHGRDRHLQGLAAGGTVAPVFAGDPQLHQLEDAGHHAVGQQQRHVRRRGPQHALVQPGLDGGGEAYGTVNVALDLGLALLGELELGPGGGGDGGGHGQSGLSRNHRLPAFGNRLAL